MPDRCLLGPLSLLEQAIRNLKTKGTQIVDSEGHDSIGQTRVKIVLSPNPAFSMVRVIDARTGSLMPDITEISVFSMQGKKMLSNSSQFDISSLPNAPYIIKISTANSSPTYLKLLKMSSKNWFLVFWAASSYSKKRLPQDPLRIRPYPCLHPTPKCNVMLQIRESFANSVGVTRKENTLHTISEKWEEMKKIPMQHAVNNNLAQKWHPPDRKEEWKMQKIF